MDAFINTHPIDPDRIYVTGQSMGGAGTYNARHYRPGVFAAAIPVCGLSDPKDNDVLLKRAIWVHKGKVAWRIAENHPWKEPNYRSSGEHCSAQATPRRLPGNGCFGKNEAQQVSKGWEFMRLFLSLILFCAPCFSSFGAEKPNIIFFLADDLGWTDLGCYGSSFYESPNIDKLASEGMKFTQAYCAGSVCSPTRASIITGQVPARTGCTQYHGSIRGTELCFAEVLRKHGYETFFTGKWHVGGKTAEEAGFQTALGMASSAKNPQDPKATRQITQNTLDFLSKQTLEQPFMAYVNYHAVHKPLLEKQSPG